MDGQPHVERRRGNGKATYEILAPVFVSYSVVLRLHPVARVLPSGEKRTQQTTLRDEVGRVSSSRAVESPT